MFLVDKKNAMKAFYYMMVIEGKPDDEEIAKFNEIGHEIDGENFESYRDEIIAECKAQLSAALEDEYAEVVREGLDKVLLNTGDVTDGVPIRMLLWDMLTISYTDDEYSENERKLLLHVVRSAGVERSVFLEMENLMKTAVNVGREIEWLQKSDRPYTEIRPLVDEIEKRYKVIVESAMALIEDDVEPDVPFEDKKSALEEKMAPVLDGLKAETKKLSEKAAPVTNVVKEGADKAMDSVKDEAGKLFGKLGSVLGKRNKKDE